MNRYTKNRSAGFAAFDAMLLSLIYVMFTLAIPTSENGDATTAKANLDAIGSDLVGSFHTTLTKLTSQPSECGSLSGSDEKAVCVAAKNTLTAMANLGVTPAGLQAYVSANPGVLAEVWSIVLSTDDDDDDLIEREDLLDDEEQVDDFTFEAEFLQKDFSNGVSTDSDSSITFGLLLAAYKQNSKYIDALVDGAKGGKSGGGDGGSSKSDEKVAEKTKDQATKLGGQADESNSNVQAQLPKKDTILEQANSVNPDDPTAQAAIKLTGDWTSLLTTFNIRKEAADDLKAQLSTLLINGRFIRSAAKTGKRKASKYQRQLKSLLRKYKAAVKTLLKLEKEMDKKLTLAQAILDGTADPGQAYKKGKKKKKNKKKKNKQ